MKSVVVVPGPLAGLVAGDLQLVRGDDRAVELGRVDERVLRTRHQHVHVDLREVRQLRHVQLSNLRH